MTAIADAYVEKLQCRSFFKCDSCERCEPGRSFTLTYAEPERLQELARITPSMRVPNSSMPRGWHTAGDKHICAMCQSNASNAQD